ncbi:hypothetical protein PP175_29235 (plasmid) [Aneurinibacillus sp. Ricciae_BoGa-3]|uniref:hypothetical protein n=1 Tax=Aneurinibacillus sp. Ricciae_BoGa-3 TaxID=3022697 RepID=UPI002341E3A3|nr:hypothetical protein [Aneurinibacillus sp. Ricciae_BoGa-3]WCK57276.1 hypothetical protein PP175_29235 [Aneurinibacillus sp. Ricciae_BoGa-3]
MANKSNQRLKKQVLLSVLSTAFVLSPLTAFAETTNSLIEKNHFAQEGYQQEKNIEQLKQKEVVIPLVQSVTPSIGASVVRPDQSVTVQLDPKAEEYKRMSSLISRGFVTAYLIDGKTATPLAQNQMQFDAVSGKVTVQHPLLTRYHQYSVVLAYGMQTRNENIVQDEKRLLPADLEKNLPSIDVVTAVDTTGDTVTLLNHGTISLPVVHTDYEGHSLVKSVQPYKVGDVVTTLRNPIDGKTHLVARNQNAISTLFTTGSDLYEPTHVSLPELNTNPSVLTNADVVVKATDDYGLPANVKVVVKTTEQGNRLANSLTMIQSPTQLTNGSADFRANDHEAEKVQVQVEVTGQYGAKSASSELQFQPGNTDKINLTPEKDYVVGKASSLKGQALDVYDNPVKDGTAIESSSSRGSLKGAQTTNGNFELAYQPSTIKGNDSLSISAKDSGKSATTNVYNRADHPAKINPKSVDAKAGTPSQLVFDVLDTFGNSVEDGEALTLSFDNNALPSQIVITQNGQVVFEVNPSTAGDFNYHIDSKENGFSYVSIAPLKVAQLETYSIDIKKDMNVLSNGMFNFNPGTWTYGGDRKQSPLADDGAIQIKNPGVSGNYSHAINNSTTATIEVEAKTLANDGYDGMNGMVLLRTGDTGFVLSLFPNKIELYDDVFSSPLFSLSINGTSYHTYRLVKDGNKGTLYIDGKAVKTFFLRVGTGYGQHWFMIGDGTSMGGNSIDVYYKSIRIAEGQALYLP